ncbi:hypothetical protein MGN70_006787 [Eutypa lata]|nr:hypothetical protein MGN70_006787 [Eutypa lata]
MTLNVIYENNSRPRLWQRELGYISSSGLTTGNQTHIVSNFTATGLGRPFARVDPEPLEVPALAEEALQTTVYITTEIQAAINAYLADVSNSPSHAVLEMSAKEAAEEHHARLADAVYRQHCLLTSLRLFDTTSRFA